MMKFIVLFSALLQVAFGAQTREPIPVGKSANPAPHFESVDGRQVFFVEGRPFQILACEIPWWDLVYGRYRETLNSYDHLYPAARSMGMNALKVPIKWSMIEPQKGVYDFSYLDHAKQMAEKNGLKLVVCWFGHMASNDGNIYTNLSGDVFAPMDIILDDKTYPRAIDADGRVHHNAASYEYPAIIEREVAAFRAFMTHIKQADAETRTILMVQVENEIAVFGWDRQNRKFWRDHSPVANQLFEEKGFTEDLCYSAWRLSTNWIKPLTEAGGQAYPLPFYLNYAGGKLADWMVGGSPGEDVATYLENCPFISFVGLNPYLPAESSVDDFRAAINGYRVGRNLTAITECNSENSPVAQRLAYIAIGEFGAPFFAPWALNTSAPTWYQPYVLEDGTLANGAPALRDCYTSLSKALSLVAWYGGTDKLKVFMAQLPGEKFSVTRDMHGTKIKMGGDQNGQAMVIHPSPSEFVFVGYRVHAAILGERFTWPAVRAVHVERGAWVGDRWTKQGEPYYYIDQSEQSINIELETPQVIRVWW